MAVLYLVKGGA